MAPRINPRSISAINWDVPLPITLTCPYTLHRSGRVANLKRGRMETRRILRLERQRAHRTALLALMCAALGVGVGMMLPRSTIASVVLLASAAVCLAAVAVARRIVRPPPRSAPGRAVALPPVDLCDLRVVPARVSSDHCVASGICDPSRARSCSTNSTRTRPRGGDLPQHRRPRHPSPRHLCPFHLCRRHPRPSHPRPFHPCRLPTHRSTPRRCHPSSRLRCRRHASRSASRTACGLGSLRSATARANT